MKFPLAYFRAHKLHVCMWGELHSSWHSLFFVHVPRKIIRCEAIMVQKMYKVSIKRDRNHCIIIVCVCVQYAIWCRNYTNKCTTMTTTTRGSLNCNMESHVCFICRIKFVVVVTLLWYFCLLFASQLSWLRCSAYLRYLLRRRDVSVNWDY